MKTTTTEKIKVPRNLHLNAGSSAKQVNLSFILDSYCSKVLETQISNLEIHKLLAIVATHIQAEDQNMLNPSNSLIKKHTNIKA